MVTNSRFYYTFVRRGGPSRSFEWKAGDPKTERKELKMNFRRARARSLPTETATSYLLCDMWTLKMYFNDFSFLPSQIHSVPQNKSPITTRKSQRTYINFIIIFRDYFYFPEQEHGYATSLPVPLETTKLRATTMASKKMSRGGSSKKTQGNRWVDVAVDIAPRTKL